jgi:hypothetical protein
MAEELAAASGQEVAFILDGRHPVKTFTPRPKIMLTADACSVLGLYCPSDFGWRCGDYGVYLARQRLPDVEHFWLVEDDIRIAGGNRPPSSKLSKASRGLIFWPTTIAARVPTGIGTSTLLGAM